MVLNIFAMPASTLILLLSAAFAATNALPWPGPAPTGVYEADEWSPRPTNTPVDPKLLFKRASVDVAVCGWLGGNSDQPAVCPTGSSCIHDIAHGYVGCCPTTGQACTAGVYTSCVDQNSPGDRSGPEIINNGIFTCPDDLLCYRNTYPAGYFQWGCGSTEQATKVETTFSNQPTDLRLQLVYRKITFAPMTRPSTTSSQTTSTSSAATTTSAKATTGDRKPSSTGASAASAAASKTAAPTSDDDDESKSKSKVNGGAIAAAVIGVVAFLAAIAGIVFFFLRRKRNQKRQEEQPNGSFINMKDVPSSPNSSQGTFPEARVQPPYSPDDFNTNLSSDASPPMDPSRSVFSSTEYQGIEQRLREGSEASAQPYYTSPSINEDGLPRVTEIEDFSREYHAAVAQISPPTPAHPQMGNISPPLTRDGYMLDSQLAENAYNNQGPYNGYGGLPDPEIHEAAEPSYRDYSHAAPPPASSYGGMAAATGAVVSTAAAARRRSSGQNYRNVRGYDAVAEEEEEDYGPLDDDYEDYGPAEGYDPLGKETGTATAVRAPPSYSPIPNYNQEIARTGEREPSGLRPQRELTPPRIVEPPRLVETSRIVERVSDSTPRYQLVDQPPTSAPVLHTPGQLRGKGLRQKHSYDGKNGDELTM